VRVFEACLVALAEHGLTPSALAARLTYLGAPDALQGAVAAGLLGGGSRFLGATEDTGRYLAAALAAAPEPLPTTNDGWDHLAKSVVLASHERGEMIPGLGHHLHKVCDPRVQRLATIAREDNTYGPHLALFEAIGRVHPAIMGRTLALNGAGACGAALADLGLPVDMLRGFSLLARTAGLLGHLAEERQSSIARPVFEAAQRAAVYVAPAGSTPPLNGHSSAS
jgi:citrate synthase